MSTAFMVSLPPNSLQMRTRFPLPNQGMIERLALVSRSPVCMNKMNLFHVTKLGDCQCGENKQRGHRSRMI